MRFNDGKADPLGRFWASTVFEPRTAARAALYRYAAGRIDRIAYRPGKFLNADLDKASDDNERNSLVISTPAGRIGVIQIAGLVARRIVSFVKEGQVLGAGERFGLIRFGSRLDVFLPEGAKALVSEGQTAIAGETVLADFKLGDGGRSYRLD